MAINNIIVSLFFILYQTSTYRYEISVYFPKAYLNFFFSVIWRNIYEYTKK